MNLSRYSNNSEEDRLFYALTPHLEELQQKVASTLWEYFPMPIIRVLELGCGTGITAQHILTANLNLTLYAIDKEPVSLEEARVKLSQHVENGKLILRKADMYEYLQDQLDQSFDAVVSALALHNCDEAYRQKTYKEIFRVLRKGGIFLNADKYATDDKEEHKKVLDWQLAQFDYFEKVGRPDLKKKWSEHYIEDEAPDLLLTEGGFIGDLKTAGFQSPQKVFRRQMEAVFVAEK